MVTAKVTTKGAKLAGRLHRAVISHPKMPSYRQNLKRKNKAVVIYH